LPVGRRPAPSWASFLFKVLLRGRRSRLPPHRSARRRPGSPREGCRLEPLRSAPTPPPRRGSRRHRVPKHSLAGATLDELVPGAFRRTRSEDRYRWRTARHDAAEAASERRLVIGAPGRSQKPEPDPVGIPPKVHRAWCARHGRLVPVAGRAEGLSQVNLGTFDAIEVCPEPKSRGAVRLGFPRCEPAILADLPKVSDVKERSEERLLGRSPVLVQSSRPVSVSPLWVRRSRFAVGRFLGCAVFLTPARPFTVKCSA
jgi:hypothetical protein